MIGNIVIGASLFVCGILLCTLYWWHRIDRKCIGEIRVDVSEQGGSPLLYLAINDDGYAKIRKGRIVSFYVQNDPPEDI